MDAASVRRMIAEDRAEWDALTTLLEAAPERRVHHDGGQWTARDVYTHFARWIEHSTADFEARLRGEDLPHPGGTDDEINARWQAEDSRIPLAEARAWAQRAFERRIMVIESTPPDRWDEGLLAIARADGAGHLGAHRRYMESAG